MNLNKGLHTSRYSVLSNCSPKAQYFNAVTLELTKITYVFQAVTRMIKDPAMSTILENRLLQGRRSNGSKCVVGQKQRRAALSSAASKNFHNGDQESQFSGRSDVQDISNIFLF